jgi:hypothetical protein
MEAYKLKGASFWSGNEKKCINFLKISHKNYIFYEDTLIVSLSRVWWK